MYYIFYSLQLHKNLIQDILCNLEKNLLSFLGCLDFF